MLNDSQIENLIIPFVERQQALESYVINTIAHRVGEIGELSKTDVYRLQQLYKTGSSAREITKEIANVAGIQEKSAKKMIKEVAVKTYADAKPFYDYRHKKQIPYEQNTKLQRSVNAIGKQTADTFKNLSNSKATGFYIRDAKNRDRLKFQSVSDTYQSVVDEAVQAVQTGVLDFDTAMRKTMKQLIDSGYRRAYWDSGYTRRLDSTVRMNILGGIRQINQQVQLQIADEIKADGIELSAHSFSAPDHEPIQGHIFTLEEFDKMQNEMDFEDIYKNKFPSMRRPIGEWNCKHFTQAVIIAQHTPTWSLKDLAKLKKDNADGYVTENGKRLSMYECTQMQRKYETEIRYAKEGYMMAKEAKNEQLMKYYEIRIAKYNREYREFSKLCGLKMQKNKASVSGFSY